MATDIFATAYEYVVNRIKTLYPQAITFCIGVPNRDECLYDRAKEYNQAIQKAVAVGGESFVYVDLFKSGLQMENYAAKSLDGLHQT